MKKPNYVFDDELYHHGIIGQMWGKRRFQNEDGSWTPAGRERYGEGEDQVRKAKADFKIHKQKAEIKSQKQLLKDKIAAKEERNRIKEQAKTAKLARKEQAKVSKVQAANYGTKLGNTKKMSDEDLQNAISRLRLEAEYNKNYALASHPNGMLARADRFFEGPTGKVVRDIAVATIPNVANTVVSKTLDSKLKYANDLDREKARADIDKTKADTNKTNAEAENARSKANQSASIAEQNRAKIARDDRESVAKIKLDQNKHKLEVAKEYARSQRLDRRTDAEIDDNRRKTNSEIDSINNQNRLDSEKQAAEQRRLDDQNKNSLELAKAASARLDEKQKHNIAMDKAKKIGYRDESNNHVSGEYEQKANKATADLFIGARNEDRKDAENQAIIDIAKARYNDASFLAAQGKTKEAERLIGMTSSISINNVKTSQKISAKYEEVIPKTEQSKPISSIIDTKTNLNSYLRDKESGLQNNEISRINSLLDSGKSLEEVARITGRSISTISKYRR